MAPRIHKTARALIIRNGSVLVMQAREEDFCHLPGGHMDPGEQPIDALIRELREELGAEVGNLQWLAKIETLWDDGRTHETMELYRVDTYPFSTPLRALEAHLTAFWVQWYGVEQIRLRPRQVYPWIARCTCSSAS